MSARPNPLPIHKASSSENVCKFKEDRLRSSGSSFKSKQRNSYGNNSKHMTNNSSQFRTGKQSNVYQKQPRPRNEWSGKAKKFPNEHQGGSKKVNLNHLLNFTYEHDEQPHHPSKYHHRKTIAKNTFYNKEQFIQANCQLLLKQNGMYEEQFADLDVPVDWDTVEKVNLWREESPTCPICLSDFCAARITKCGHIYCWPCILHYLALDDKTWRKCPICHEAVHKNDLKSVSVHKERTYKVQSVITMQLMRRARDSMIGVPVTKQMSESNLQYKFDEKLSSSEQRNKKYLVASAQQIVENIVEVEKAQLEFKLATEPDSFEQTFIKSALDICNERESALRKEIKLDGNTILEKEHKPVVGYYPESSPVVHDSSITSSVNGKDLIFELENEDGCMERNGVDDKQNDENFVYFYQASDGQHTYMHPLNSRCLLHQYGSYSNCPPQISAKILESDEFTINEKTRKRYRNLGHLPLSLEFRIVELDLRPPLVSADTLASFQDALTYRAGMRKKKAREEKKILRRSQNEALRKQGKYPEARICLENLQQFPQIQSPNSTGSSYSVLFPSPGTTPCDESLMPSTSATGFSPEESIASSSSESSVSFAQMLKTSTSDHSAWVRRTPLSKPAPQNRTDTDEEEEGFSAPNYHAAFEDALNAAFENMDTPRGKKTKKGKKKKVVLFSTGNQRY